MIGVSCTGFSARPLEEILEEVSHEFTHWEIVSEAEHSIGHIWERLKNAMGCYDLTYSLHTPISDANIASLSDRMRESSVLEMIANVELASALGIGTITVHPGLESMSVPGMKEKSMENAKRSLRILDRTATEYGVTLAIENMPRFPPMLGKTAEELKELIDGTGLSICFDVGHAHTNNQIEEMISTFKDRMANIHVHDNNGESDEHLTVGDGTVDFPGTMKSLGGYEGKYVIESKSLASAVESKRRLSILLE